MKFIARAVLGGMLALSIASCGSATTAKPDPLVTTAAPAPADTSAPSSTGGTSALASTDAQRQVVSAQALAAVVCSDTPIRMDKSAELYTKESWNCTASGEKARIDLYADAAQQQKAAQVLLDFYKSSGDNRTLADLPIVCGTGWAIGVDFNETRDALIPKLVAAGFDASIC